MKSFFVTLALAACIALPANAQVQNPCNPCSKKKVENPCNPCSKKGSAAVAIKGEIIDVKCFTTGMMGGRGEKHKECAISCIEGGLPVGILDTKTGKAYVVVPAKGMKGANEALLPYVAETVTLKGEFIEKGGQKLFAYSSIEK